MSGNAEIYSYESNTMVYAMNWSVRPDKPFRLAVGSFVEEYANQVSLIHLDSKRGTLVASPRHTFRHPYPPTKIAFSPDTDGTSRDLLATSGDFLRIWNITSEGVVLERLLNNNNNLAGGNSSNNKLSSTDGGGCAPITSFDWSDIDPGRIAAASIDTTVTIWDVERGIIDTQLIAHDKEVYDVAWGGVGVFASVSADASVRVFDLRDKDHSTIVYEAPRPARPLIRLAWNRQDPKIMAVIAMDSSQVVILDVRFPTAPIATLTRHTAPVNAVAWAPHSSTHLCSVGDDSQALIWGISPHLQQQQQQGGATRTRSMSEVDPVLAYNAGMEVNQLQWSLANPDWVAICYGNKTEILKV